MSKSTEQATIFAQLTKVDEVARTVTGRAVQQVPDHANEVFDYHKSKPHFEAWAANTHKASGGKSLGNVRAMHGNVAAGKLKDIIFNDAEMAIDVTAKVVDDAEFAKVLEGVYTGFSIGGRYVNKTKRGDLTYYEADPTELSLVDAPCVPTALFFNVHKADGAVLQKSFKLPEPPTASAPAVDYEVEGSPQDLAALSDVMNKCKLSVGSVTQLVKDVASADSAELRKWAGKLGVAAAEKVFADPVNQRFPLDNDAQVAAAAYYVRQEAAKALYADTPDVYKAVLEAVDAAFEAAFGKGQGAELKKAALPTADLRKSFYTSACLAAAIDNMLYLVDGIEFQYASMGAPEIGAQAKMALGMLAQTLGSMVAYDVAQLNGAEPDEATKSITAKLASLAKAAVVSDEDLAKAGARNNKTDQATIDAIHKAVCTLGAKCDKGNLAEAMEDAAKASSAPVEKALTLEAVSDLINKAVGAATAPLQQELAVLKAAPAPARAVLRAVSKGQDVEETTPTQTTPVLKADGGVDEVATSIKGVHKSGGQPFSFGALR